MNTFFKIAILASFIIGAIVSVFVFSGTRIVEGVDVSNVMIHESDFVDDIQNEISGIGHEWLADFYRVHDLITVYNNNHLLSSSNEKNVEVSLVDKAALRLTTFALEDYFLRSSWNQSDISSFRRNAEMLLRHTSANGSLAAEGEAKSRLESVKRTCDNYFEAKRLVLVYNGNSNAQNIISRAQALRTDSYLMHETTIKNKLNGAAQTIHQSHWEQIIGSIRDLQNLSEYSNFNTVRSKVSRISALITAYRSANFYPSKNESGLSSMISDANDEINFWNGKILEQVSEDYYDTYSGSWKKRQVRKYPQEQTISKL